MLHEHLPRELPAYEVTKRRVRVFKVDQWWFWHHHCLHGIPVSGMPHDTRESAMEWALKHWGRCL